MAYKTAERKYVTATLLSFHDWNLTLFLAAAYKKAKGKATPVHKTSQIFPLFDYSMQKIQKLQNTTLRYNVKYSLFLIPVYKW